MGAEPYSYFVRYEPDLNAALQKLRKQEFRAGRYDPGRDSDDDEDPLATPRPRHQSIDEAREAAMEDGTRSILDLDHISDQPEFCAASPLPDEMLLELFGTTHPTREMVEKNDGFYDDIERGQGIYIVVYREGKPDEIFFAGYSFD